MKIEDVFQVSFYRRNSQCYLFYFPISNFKKRWDFFYGRVRAAHIFTFLCGLFFVVFFFFIFFYFFLFFFFLCLRCVTYTTLPESLDCPVFNAPSVFSNV